MKPYTAHWVEVENGVTALKILDVAMASFLMKAERPDQSGGWMSDLDDAWWQKAAQTAAQREGKGKFAGLIFKRNVFTHEDPLTAGRFENLRWQRPYAVADLVITDPEEIAAVIRGERTQLSIDGRPNEFLVWGVELIQGSEGHFSEDIPELRVSGVSVRDPQFRELKSAAVTAARLRAPDQDLVALAAAKPQEQTMLTPEVIEEIKKIVREVMGEKPAQPPAPAAAPAAQASAAPAAPAPAAPAAKPEAPADANEKRDPADAVKLARDLEAEQLKNAELSARVATFEREREIDGYVAKLRKAGHALTDEALRDQFVKLATKEGREECFKRLETFKLNRDDAPTDPELTRTTAKEAALREHLKLEYKKREDEWKADGFETAEQYVAFHMKNHAK